MKDLLCQYDYKPPLLPLFLAGAFFASASAVLGAVASSNDRGLELFHFVELSIAQATAFYWALSGLGIAFVLMAAAAIIRSFFTRGLLVITKEGVTLPKGRWTYDTVTIPFSDIHELAVHEIAGQRQLRIHSHQGSFVISAAMLPRNDDLDAVSSILEREIAASR